MIVWASKHGGRGHQRHRCRARVRKAMSSDDDVILVSETKPPGLPTSNKRARQGELGSGNGPAGAAVLGASSSDGAATATGGSDPCTGTNCITPTGEFALDSLQCAICIDLLCDPCVVPCGHDFCRTCIEEVVRSSRHRGTCPVCRSTFTAGTLGVNRKLKTVIERLYPKDSSRRAREVAEDQERRRKERVAREEQEAAAAAAAPPPQWGGRTGGSAAAAERRRASYDRLRSLMESMHALREGRHADFMQGWEARWELGSPRSRSPPLPRMPGSGAEAAATGLSSGGNAAPSIPAPLGTTRPSADEADTTTDYFRMWNTRSVQPGAPPSAGGGSGGPAVRATLRSSLQNMQQTAHALMEQGMNETAQFMTSFPPPPPPSASVRPPSPSARGLPAPSDWERDIPGNRSLHRYLQERAARQRTEQAFPGFPPPMRQRSHEVQRDVHAGSSARNSDSRTGGAGGNSGDGALGQGSNTAAGAPAFTGAVFGPSGAAAGASSLPHGPAGDGQYAIQVPRRGLRSSLTMPRVHSPTFPLTSLMGPRRDLSSAPGLPEASRPGLAPPGAPSASGVPNPPISRTGTAPGTQCPAAQPSSPRPLGLGDDDVDDPDSGLQTARYYRNAARMLLRQPAARFRAAAPGSGTAPGTPGGVSGGGGGGSSNVAAAVSGGGGGGSEPGRRTASSQGGGSDPSGLQYFEDIMGNFERNVRSWDAPMPPRRSGFARASTSRAQTGGSLAHSLEPLQHAGQGGTGEGGGAGGGQGAPVAPSQPAGASASAGGHEPSQARQSTEGTFDEIDQLDRALRDCMQAFVGPPPGRPSVQPHQHRQLPSPAAGTSSATATAGAPGQLDGASHARQATDPSGGRDTTAPGTAMERGAALPQPSRSFQPPHGRQGGETALTVDFDEMFVDLFLERGSRLLPQPPPLPSHLSFLAPPLAPPPMPPTLSLLASGLMGLGEALPADPDVWPGPPPTYGMLEGLLAESILPPSEQRRGQQGQGQEEQLRQGQEQGQGLSGVQRQQGQGQRELGLQGHGQGQRTELYFEDADAEPGAEQGDGGSAFGVAAPSGASARQGPGQDETRGDHAAPSQGQSRSQLQQQDGGGWRAAANPYPGSVPERVWRRRHAWLQEEEEDDDNLWR